MPAARRRKTWNGRAYDGSMVRVIPASPLAESTPVGSGPIRCRLAAVLFAVALLVPVSDAAAGGCAHAGLTPGAGDAGKARKATLCLLNRERARHGLGRMQGDRKLRRAATRHSKDMVARRFFDHVAPGGVTLTERVSAVDYLKATASSWFLAENIAWGSGSYGTPRGIVRQWMSSPPHRANVLNPRVRDAGIGVAVGAPNGGRGATYTLDLGRTG
jgi:uncharacterized protein YkwD